ncbi:MAG: hypothetical protein OEZ40_08060, partial [Candidatus Bathyarchaeota archaeon]|nr:hypothetical protein [Candidatus Bathyarchaeota archaeon]
MKIKEIYAGIASVGMICLMLSIALSQGVHLSGLPKVDEILYKAYPGATVDTVVDEFLLEVTDWMDGPYRIDLYNRMIVAGQKLSTMDPMSKFDFIAINCRDYDGTSGAVNMPLNDSNFRIALSYIYGVNDKQTDIFAYVGTPWTFAIDNPVPPAQEPWYDEDIQMPNTDWDAAWTLLQANGYNIDGDSDLCSGTTKLRDLTVWYPTGSLYWERGPGVGFVRNFNDFISYIGADSPVMALVPVSFATLVSQLLVLHDFDFVCHSLTDLGRYVDWLYDCLHSDNIGVWGWNFCGVIDSFFDVWTEAILTDLSVDNVIGNASLVQDRFVNELMPWFPISSGVAFCTTARDARGELMNLISMPNYGPMNDWSWMCLHWKGAWPGGTIKVALDAEWHTMNPYTEHTPYGWQILDRAVTGLLSLDPNTLQDTPFIATEWSQTPGISIPELGIIDGSIVTFYLRQDVLWHDLEPVTAYDCVNNMRLLRQYRPGKYSSTWAMLVYEEPDGPYKFNAYFYTPSLYHIENVAETALLSPKHITDTAEAMY